MIPASLLVIMWTLAPQVESPEMPITHQDRQRARGSYQKDFFCNGLWAQETAPRALEKKALGSCMKTCSGNSVQACALKQAIVFLVLPFCIFFGTLQDKNLKLVLIALHKIHTLLLN